jgi:hypothetical protein
VKFIFIYLRDTFKLYGLRSLGTAYFFGSTCWSTRSSSWASTRLLVYIYLLIDMEFSSSLKKHNQVRVKNMHISSSFCLPVEFTSSVAGFHHFWLAKSRNLFVRKKSSHFSIMKFTTSCLGIAHVSSLLFSEEGYIDKSSLRADSKFSFLGPK